MLMGTYSPPQTATFNDKYVEQDDCGKFLESMRRTSLLERYDHATRELFRREQSPEMLVKLVQSKIAERVNNYAEQLKFVKLEFHQYKLNPEVGFNEGALREVLMRMNIHLDDVQFLALFAFFDIDGVGKDFLNFDDICRVRVLVSHYNSVRNLECIAFKFTAR
jgi:hypothetical protein